MTSRAKTTRFGTATLDHRHVCMFYRTQDEIYQALIPFIEERIERGEKIFQMVDPARYDETLCRLVEGGIPVERTTRTGQLELQKWDESFLLDGHFEPEPMLAFIEQRLQDFRSEGYPLTRWIGQMEWPAKRSSRYVDFLEFEAQVNYIADKREDFLVCTYDLSKHDGGLVLDALRTHPLVVIGENAHENPFYIPPDEFLSELRAREALPTVT